MVADLKNNKRLQQTASIFVGDRYTRLENSLSNIRGQAKFKVSDNMLQPTREMVLSGVARWWIHTPLQQLESVSARNSAQLVGLNSGIDPKILKLAAKYRMNNDVKRAVFCIIFTADDYMDAYEKITKLGLKGAQQREPPRTVLLCCIKERTFNKYYGALAYWMCQNSRSEAFTFQLAFWDQIKALESMPIRELSNCAKLLAFLISKGSLSLSVLKVLPFGELSDHADLFLTLCLGSVLNLCTDDAKPFRAVQGNQELRQLVRGCQLFIENRFLEDVDAAAQQCGLDAATLRSKAKVVCRVLKNSRELVAF